MLVSWEVDHRPGRRSTTACCCCWRRACWACSSPATSSSSTCSSSSRSIPLFFLIGIWGSEERRYAAIKFFLFTLAGSVLTLLGLLAIVLWDYFS